MNANARTAKKPAAKRPRPQAKHAPWRRMSADPPVGAGPGCGPGYGYDAQGKR
ncbi:hypothetical protein RR11_906 [Ruegeria sp. R11]|nr:hypothetical protein RR11_906 [Ruegeria sp. R11]